MKLSVYYLLLLVILISCFRTDDKVNLLALQVRDVKETTEMKIVKQRNIFEDYYKSYSLSSNIKGTLFNKSGLWFFNLVLGIKDSSSKGKTHLEFPADTAIAKFHLFGFYMDTTKFTVREVFGCIPSGSITISIQDKTETLKFDLNGFDSTMKIAFSYKGERKFNQAKE